MLKFLNSTAHTKLGMIIQVFSQKKAKSLGYAKAKCISHLSLDYTLHTLEEGEFFQGIRFKRNCKYK